MPTLNARAAVLVVLSLIGLALAATLAFAPANRRANRALALLLAVIAALCADYVIDLARLDRDHRWLRYLPLSLPLAIGPLLYAYVIGLVRRQAPAKAWLHALPALLQALYLIGFFLLPAGVQDVLDDGRGRDLARKVLEVATVLSLAAYAVAGLRLLGRYRHRLLQQRSDADLYAARWVSALLVFLVGTLGAYAAIRGYIWLVGRLSVFEVYGYYLWLAGMGVVMGVEGRRLADRRFPLLDDEPEHSAAPARDWRALGEDWRRRTREAGWWREPGLTLADLARRLGVNTSYLSRGINEGLGVNFSEMINRLRAEAVASALDEGASGDLLDLAFDAGFSSKASFNRAFRATIGMSPSAWRARPRS